MPNNSSMNGKLRLERAMLLVVEHNGPMMKARIGFMRH
jgi:hypothetical protein